MERRKIEAKAERKYRMNEEGKRFVVSPQTETSLVNGVSTLIDHFKLIR